MQHYTTIEQSKKLLELGLSPETADLYYSMLYHIDKLYHVPNLGEPIKVLSLYNEGHTLGGKYKPKTLEEFCIPCWSLGALLEVMPDYIRNYNQLNKTTRVYGLNLFRSAYHCCGYSYGPSLNEENQDSLCCFGCDTWIEAAYKTVCWLLKNNYIKKGE